MKGENKLKQLLAERNLSQKQLAERMGVTQPLVAKWCKPNSDPKTSTLVRIAKELNVSLRKLIENLGEDVSGIPDDCIGGEEQN